MTIISDYSLNQINSSQGSSQKNGYDLDMADFFKLFAAQLQNQNMFDPVDNTQYIAQMAQFSTLSQMQELVTSFRSVQALSLMGKNVHLISQNINGAYESISGEVAGVVYNNGTPYLEIGKKLYEANAVYKVEEFQKENLMPESSENTQNKIEESPPENELAGEGLEESL